MSDDRRLRLQHFVVQPVFIWDDGEELSPGPAVEPQPLTLAGLNDLLETWTEKLSQIQAQVASES